MWDGSNFLWLIQQLGMANIKQLLSILVHVLFMWARWLNSFSDINHVYILTEM